MSDTNTQTHTIDATGKRLGRVASEAASILMGKDRTDFARNKNPNVQVLIENASKLNISEKKKEQKEYVTYSGYVGGQKHTPMEEVIEKKGYGEVVRRAVSGMLPKNRLQAPMLKRLTVSE